MGQPSESSSILFLGVRIQEVSQASAGFPEKLEDANIGELEIFCCFVFVMYSTYTYILGFFAVKVRPFVFLKLGQLYLHHGLFKNIRLDICEFCLFSFYLKLIFQLYLLFSFYYFHYYLLLLSTLPLAYSAGSQCGVWEALSLDRYLLGPLGCR